MSPEEWWRVRVEDILEAVDRAREYTAELTAEAFFAEPFRRLLDTDDPR